MIKRLAFILVFISIAAGTYDSAKAQTLQLFGSNTLNGAMNGVLLGGATMALQNSTEFEPVRVGLGAGTLFGVGVGVHDVSQISTGQQFYISGTFNDGTNSSVLILLDTIYGAAGGALLATSISLITQDPLLDALQYGTGAGAWLGFGLGLMDAFVFAKGPNYAPQGNLALTQRQVSGLLTYSNSAHSLSLGMLNPHFIAQKKLTQSSLTTTFTPAVRVLQLKVGFN